MLRIDIVGSSGNNLLLEVNGHPNNGRSSAVKSEQVHWKVKEGIDVDYISAITWKNMPGSEDVFSHHRPAEQENKKNWKGRVNGDAEDYSVYVYSITWVKAGDGTTHIFDPIISINPSTTFYDITKVLLFTATALLAFLTLQFLRKNKKYK
jgi:hypothetical protein